MEKNGFFHRIYTHNIKTIFKMLQISTISTIMNTLTTFGATRRPMGTGTGTAVPTNRCGLKGIT
jgi:hypothetical protein